jgi:primosomal protein N' (replication factor Y) (superfamily II helicase)
MTEPEVIDEPLAPNAPRYAVVIVQTPLQRKVTSYPGATPDREDTNYLARAFHYHVPDTMRAQICVGQLVWVPFHGQHLQGIIIAIDDHSPVEKTLDIGQIVDLDPVLSPAHIALAQWISEYYLAPIQRVVQTMLPPGVTQGVDVRVEIVPDLCPEGATAAQEQLLEQLRRRGALSLQQIARLTPERDWRAVASQLVTHGWASKRAVPRSPGAKPKTEPVIRLPIGADPTDAALRGSQRQQALRYLLARGEARHEWLPLKVAATESGVGAEVFRILAQKGWVELSQRQVWRDPFEGQTFVPTTPPRMTPAQEEAWRVIAADLEQPAGRPFLLRGVTGSGKTEIYLRATQRVLAQGRSVIILVPEIALTPQTIRRFGARFPTTLAVMHSHLTPGERYDQWRQLRAGDLRLVIGSRSAIFAPLRNLGLIVLDEEHEGSYKQDQTPHYHAREVAVRLAKLVGATCILGSATPDLESTYRVERGEYECLCMPQRVLGHRHIVEEQATQLHLAQEHYHPLDPVLEETLYAELPPVEVVDMRAELRMGNKSVFSRSLQKGIEVALASHEQIILFLNRRGTASFVMCRDCGHVLKCPRCELPLTYHSAVDDLICHHCNYKTFVPPQCPSCWSGRIKFFGLGTQRIEELVHEAYPQARAVRWDLDTTGGKLAHEQLLDQFIRGEADIMIGTQMIAKGLDLPKVTLVGVIAADTMLNLPDYRSAERTFQLLTQVAGRAGRSILGGKVVIQTYMPQHPAIQAASKHDYDAFYRQEIAGRRQLWYPPLSRLIQLVYSDSNEDKARREVERLHRVLTLKIAREGLPEVNLIGPAPAFFARLRGKSRWQLLIRGTDPHALVRDTRLALGWQVVVDPVSLL